MEAGAGVSDTTSDVSAATPSFYVTGGTLQRGAASYVERQADRDLYAGLTRGEFCYVLTSRQMGKSSLMVHTAARLREEGVAVAVLDLTGIGQMLTPEQWYDGLLARLGQQLDLEDELEAFWLNHEKLGPLQRWMTSLREVVLPAVVTRHSSSVTRHPSEVSPQPAPLTDDGSRMTNDAGRVVIFLDEIDAVRNLSFSTDEFFAGIRECYNRRSEDPEFARLAFCLLGVATPSDLIQDTRTTPFNIGTRIDLTDFTPSEAAPLAKGMGCEEATGAVLLQRVLSWTGGHPYLTQRLCRTVAEGVSVTSAAGVDWLCAELFLSSQAQERDDNLLFVRERLLRSEGDRAGLLDLYAQVRSSQRVPLDDTNQLVGLLRLSGITRVEDGSLRVRNRIYERVFDRKWITQHMPDAELRRQRAAFQRGLLRAAAVSAVILTAMGGLALTAARQARRANQQRRVAQQQRLRAEEGQETLRRHLYAAQMPLVFQAWEGGNIERAQEILDAQRPHAGQKDLRGFEWRYLWRLCQSDARFTLRGHQGEVSHVAFTPDGRTLASSASDNTVRLWDIVSQQPVGTLRGNAGGGIAFSPDGKTLASGGGDGVVKLWDVRTRREVAALHGHKGRVLGVAFSPGGKILATGADDNLVKLWDVATRRELASLKGHTNFITTVAFSPDATTLATGSVDTTARLWNVAAKREIARLQHVGLVQCVAFSPDGKTLATGSVEVKLWDVATGQNTPLSKVIQTGSIRWRFRPMARRSLRGPLTG